MRQRRHNSTAGHRARLIFIIAWLLLCIGMLLWYSLIRGPAIQP